MLNITIFFDLKYKKGIFKKLYKCEHVIVSHNDVHFALSNLYKGSNEFANTN